MAGPAPKTEAPPKEYGALGGAYSASDRREMEAAKQRDALSRSVGEAHDYVSKLESDTAKALQQVNGGRAPSQSELEMEAWKRAREEGRDYYGLKHYLAAQPGPVRKFLGLVKDQVVGASQDVLGGAVHALVDRTEDVRAADSSLPHISGTIPGAGLLDSAQTWVANNQSPGVRPIPPREENPYAGSFTLGASDLADALEVALPLGADAIALGSKNMGPWGKAASIVAGNVGGELSAEFVRMADRRAANLPNHAVDISDPTDMALHFAKVLSGGMMLGAADMLTAESTLRGERRAYKLLAGLGTPESDAVIRKMHRIGVEPTLSQAMTTPLKIIGTSLSLYPLTGTKAIARARQIKGAVTRHVSNVVGGFADHLMSGVHIADRSKQWFNKNDQYLQLVGRRASHSYELVKAEMQRAEGQVGLQGMNVPIQQAKDDVRAAVFDRIGRLPAGTRSSLERNPDYQTLVNFIERGDTHILPSEAIQLRNELEWAATRASGAHDPVGSVFATAAARLRAAIENEAVMPDNVRALLAGATREWSDMHALMRAPAWEAFRKADSQFGMPDKVGASMSISSEAVLMNAMQDPNLTPDIVGTWWRAANEGHAVPQFRAAVESHVRKGYELAVKTPETGPLAGVEVIDPKRLMAFLGANEPSGNKWAAHADMIRKAGGNPDEFLGFLKDIKDLFPDGVPNISGMAARRTALSGVGSAVRMLTGASAVGAYVKTRGGGETEQKGVLTGLGTAIATMLAFRGVGKLMFEPGSLKYMRRVMDKNISEQGRWRQLWALTASWGLTRRVQDVLQAHGVDPLVTPTRAEQLENESRLTRDKPASAMSLPQQPTPAPYNPDPHNQATPFMVPR